jgi:gliding motility-associated-like protein
MKWSIYNRWGQLVYASTDRNQGWDGRYKGVLQPQEVYTYTLEIEFTDGTRATKTGDITLLR